MRQSARNMDYYPQVGAHVASVEIDVSETSHKVLEAWATQVSQHALMGTSAEELLAQAEQIRRGGRKYVETFWLAEHNALNDFLPRRLYVGKA